MPFDEVRKLPTSQTVPMPMVVLTRRWPAAESRLSPRRRLHRGHPLGDLIGRMQQYFPLLGQHEAACVAMEQRGGEVLLERTDLLG